MWNSYWGLRYLLLVTHIILPSSHFLLLLQVWHLCLMLPPPKYSGYWGCTAAQSWGERELLQNIADRWYVVLLHTLKYLLKTESEALHGPSIYYTLLSAMCLPSAMSHTEQQHFGKLAIWCSLTYRQIFPWKAFVHSLCSYHLYVNFPLISILF